MMGKNKLNLRLVIVAAMFLSVSPPAKSASDLEVVELEVLDKYFFGEVVIDGEANHRKKTNRIPNVPEKVCFGWVIKVKPSGELVKITEIFTLPAAPKAWVGVDNDPYSQTTTSQDRKIATTRRFMPLKNGILENSWCIGKGDPNGSHHIVVLNNTQVLAEFEFEVYD